MNLRFAVVAAVVAATALAGCMGPEQGSAQGTASTISFTSAPTQAAPGSKPVVCWRIDGSGTVPHTAVHYGPASHAGAGASFSDYPSVMYPGNATSAAAQGYALPATFCTAIEAGQGDVYVRAHVIDRAGAPGKLTPERQITVESTPATPLVVRFAGALNATAPANSTITVCWRVEGTNGTIPHTAIHTDTVSHRAAATFGEYRGPAYYPNNATGQSPVQVPGDFCTGARMPANGTLYLRAHAMVEPPGVLSPEERSVAVNNTTAALGVATLVRFLDAAPATAPAGSNLTVCWEVQGTGSIPHTAIHTSNTSRATALSFQEYDGPAYYPANATAQVQVTLPGTFCTNVRAPAQMGQSVYLRAHAIDSAGAPGRLSPQEKQLTAA